MLSCKFYFDKAATTRRSSFQSFAALVEIANGFVETPSRYLVKYKDEEGEFITISSERELQECLQFQSKEGVLKLFIHEAKNEDACLKKGEHVKEAPATDLDDACVVIRKEDLVGATTPPAKTAETKTETKETVQSKQDTKAPAKLDTPAKPADSNSATPVTATLTETKQATPTTPAVAVAAATNTFIAALDKKAAEAAKPVEVAAAPAKLDAAEVTQRVVGLFDSFLAEAVKALPVSTQQQPSFTAARASFVRDVEAYLAVLQAQQKPVETKTQPQVTAQPQTPQTQPQPAAKPAVDSSPAAAATDSKKATPAEPEKKATPAASTASTATAAPADKPAAVERKKSNEVKETKDKDVAATAKDAVKPDAKAAKPAETKKDEPKKEAKPALLRPHSKYQKELDNLDLMGFSDVELNDYLLQLHKGDVQKVINHLVTGR